MKLIFTKEKAAILAAVIVLAGTFSFLGMTGVRTVLGFFFIFILPAYLLLDLFGLRTEEKLFIGLFLGLGLFPLAVFYVDRIVPSLRLSILVTYLLVVAIWFFGKRRKARASSRPRKGLPQKEPAAQEAQ